MYTLHNKQSITYVKGLKLLLSVESDTEREHNFPVRLLYPCDRLQCLFSTAVPLLSFSILYKLRKPFDFDTSNFAVFLHIRE
jgi:hypothetical protein